jgi:hypothetical protein
MHFGFDHLGAACEPARVRGGPLPADRGVERSGEHLVDASDPGGAELEGGVPVFEAVGSELVDEGVAEAGDDPPVDDGPVVAGRVGGEVGGR